MKGKKFLEFTVAILFAFVALVVVLASCENRIIYHPYKYPDGNWGPAEDLLVEDVWFRAADGVKLHGWYVPGKDARATLLFFHGNAGNITHRLDNLRRLQPLRLNIFIFDYRGYGRSEGRPDEAGLLLDTEAAYRTLVETRQVSPDRLFLFGRSLGGVFAVHAASRHPVAGLILESTFTNARDMANKMFPLLPVGFALKSKLDAVGPAASLRIPKLFLHGTEDEVVPYGLGRKLYEAAAAPKEFYDIAGAGHNDTYEVGGADYFARLDRFITETLDASSAGSGFPLK